MGTDYKGIDYGMGLTNRDKANGIRFGVIHHSEVGQVWYDSSEANYVHVCPICETEMDEPFLCRNCDKEFEPEDFDGLDPISFSIDDGEYQAEQSFDDSDIFILKSPYYTYSQFCSPCAPGAGYLMNELQPKNRKDIEREFPDNKTYCFGHDWFESGKAPYKVYRVSDNSLVE